MPDFVPEDVLKSLITARTELVQQFELVHFPGAMAYVKTPVKR